MFERAIPSQTSEILRNMESDAMAFAAKKVDLKDIISIVANELKIFLA